jgi:hypothetical protein
MVLLSLDQNIVGLDIWSASATARLHAQKKPILPVWIMF